MGLFGGYAGDRYAEYLELKRQFPVGTKVVCIDPQTVSLQWGRVYTVTGHKHIFPTLLLAGVGLSVNDSRFQWLEKQQLCVHQTHIVGGDCTSCATQKRLDAIATNEKYKFEEDPYYAELLRESENKKFTTMTATILEEFSTQRAKKRTKKTRALA